MKYTLFYLFCNCFMVQFFMVNSLADFHGDLIDFFKQNMKSPMRVICPSCGYEFSNFRQTGRLGCSKCYDVFHDEIIRQIRQLHG